MILQVLNARPLYDNIADASFFVEPPIWAPLLRAIDRELNVALSGSRGYGKTTVLRQAQRQLRDQGRRVAYVDAVAVDEASELASRLRGAITGRQMVASEAVGAAFATISAKPTPVAGASRALYADLVAVNDVEPTVVLIDASGSASAVFGIFGRMRDVLWQGRHTWVVAMDQGQRSAALRPPADAFFDVVLTMHPWDPGPLLQLLRLRTDDFTDFELGEIAQSSLGDPRSALRSLAHAAVSDRTIAELATERARAERAAASLGRPQSMLLSELIARGQSSPSDQDLQRSLGVSRARLTQLMRDLLAEGLVVTEQAKSDGPGRPRTIYRPAFEQ